MDVKRSCHLRHQYEDNDCTNGDYGSKFNCGLCIVGGLVPVGGPGSKFEFLLLSLQRGCLERFQIVEDVKHTRRVKLVTSICEGLKTLVEVFQSVTRMEYCNTVEQ